MTKLSTTLPRSRHGRTVVPHQLSSLSYLTKYITTSLSNLSFCNYSSIWHAFEVSPSYAHMQLKICIEVTTISKASISLSNLMPAPGVVKQAALNIHWNTYAIILEYFIAVNDAPSILTYRGTAIRNQRATNFAAHVMAPYLASACLGWHLRLRLHIPIISIRKNSLFCLFFLSYLGEVVLFSYNIRNRQTPDMGRLWWRAWQMPG